MGTVTETEGIFGGGERVLSHIVTGVINHALTHSLTPYISLNDLGINSNICCN